MTDDLFAMYGSPFAFDDVDLPRWEQDRTPDELNDILSKARSPGTHEPLSAIVPLRHVARCASPLELYRMVGGALGDAAKHVDAFPHRASRAGEKVFRCFGHYVARPETVRLAEQVVMAATPAAARSGNDTVRNLVFTRTALFAVPGTLLVAATDGDGVLWVSRPPAINRDALRRRGAELVGRSTSVPTMRWPDGAAAFMYDGLLLDPRIADPETPAKTLLRTNPLRAGLQALQDGPPERLAKAFQLLRHAGRNLRVANVSVICDVEQRAVLQGVDADGTPTIAILDRL